MGFSFTWRIAQNDLPKIIDNLSSKGGNTVQIVADEIRDDVKSRSPVDTGAMQEGYYDTMTGTWTAEVRSGDDLGYPLYVEMGHHTRSGSWVPPQPHFVVCFDAAGGNNAFVRAAQQSGLFAV